MRNERWAGNPEGKQQMNALSEATRNRIKERRLALGLTQKEAAAAGDMAATTFNTVEVGRSPASGLVRAGICRALGWTADSIERLERGDDPKEDIAADAGARPVDPGFAATYGELVKKLEELEKEVRETAPMRPAAAAGVDLTGLPEEDAEMIRALVRRTRRLNGLPEDPHE